VASPSPERVARPATSASIASLAPINSFRVSVERRERPVRSTDGSARVSWQIDWRLSWPAVPGATEYAVYYGTSEGASAQPRTVQAGRSLTVQAAAGTSSRARLRGDQRAALLFTSSQLLVAVAPRGEGTSGVRSPWFPVGDVPPDGVPVGTAGLGSG
jgi:hypothetical protein